MILKRQCASITFRLNELYEGWISDYKGRLLIIEGDTLKFESDRAAFRQITDRIDSELFGLFPNE